MKFDIGTSNQFSPATKLFIENCWSNGLNCLIASVNIDPLKINEFLQGVDKDKFGVSNLSTFNQQIIAESTALSFCLYVDNGTLTICAYSYRLAVEFLEKNKRFINFNSDESIRVNYYFLGAHGVDFNEIVIKKSTITHVYPELYPDIDIAELCSDFISSKEPILFLVGDPGVGKTSLIRFFLRHFVSQQEEKYNGDSQIDEPIATLRATHAISYVKDMSVMTQSEFWSVLASRDSSLLILDDLDFALAPREAKDDGFVNNLLSYSDGIFGSHPKIIVTTNVKVNEIDKALLRPGRCFDFLKLATLKRDQALKVWSDCLNQSEQDFAAKWPQQDSIAQADIMSYFRRLQTANKERRYNKTGPRVYNVEDRIRDVLENKVGFGVK